MTNEVEPGRCCKRLAKTALLIGMALCCLRNAGAEVVYKCLQGGTPNFTSHPVGDQGSCQPVELNVVEPNPVDVARQLEQKRFDAEKEQAEAEKQREGREQRELEDKLRRAGSAGEAVRLLQDSPSSVRKGGRLRNWTGIYPHRGAGPSERYVVQEPVDRGQSSDSNQPTGAGKKP